MKLTHSLGFLLLGGVMALLPQLAPSLSAAEFYRGDTRAIWLHLMGLVQVGIGLGYILSKAAGDLAAWLERWPELVTAVTATERNSEAEFPPVPGPTLGRNLGTVRREGELIPVSFRPSWSEQRRAA